MPFEGAEGGNSDIPLAIGGPCRNAHRLTHPRGHQSALRTGRRHTARMKMAAALSIWVLGLSVAGCGSTRQPDTSGCASELRFRGATYCDYGDVTGASKDRPTHPLGDAQPWGHGSAIPSRPSVPVQGFNSVSQGRVIAVARASDPRKLALYIIEDSTPRMRDRIVTSIDLSNAREVK